MKLFVRDGKVYVMNDDATELDESSAVVGSCRQFCIAAALAMPGMGVVRHTSYIDPEDVNECAGFEADGRVLVVTIEWVAESETRLPDMANAACSAMWV